MSYPIMSGFPLSMAKGLKKSVQFNSVVQKTAAFRGTSSISLTPFPVWAFDADLDNVTGNESLATSVFATFLGIYMACQGQNGTFLFQDPQDSVVTYGNSCMLNVSNDSMALV